MNPPAPALAIVDDPAEFKRYLRGSIVMTENLADAFIAQGLDTFKELSGITQDDVHQIVSIIRKPGGTIPNPASTAARPPQIADPGLKVTYLQEKRLKCLVHYLKTCCRTQRDFQPAEATREKLQETALQKEIEEEIEKSTIVVPKKLSTSKKVRESLDDISNFLSKKRGKWGIYLAYIIRENDHSDPTTLPDGPFATVDDEMIERAPHSGAKFKSDNVIVWNIVRDVFYDTEGWSWVSQFERKKDGRAAVQAVEDHYIGSHGANALSEKAESQLDTAHYNGEKRGFDFESYCRIHKESYVTLDKYDPEHKIPEANRVKKFLKGIKAPYLDSSVKAVIANPELAKTLEKTMNFITMFIERMPNSLGG